MPELGIYACNSQRRLDKMGKRDDVMADDPEKTADASTSSFDLDDKDEALRLVGLERTETFTEEQYRKVRWKLVGISTRLLSHCMPSAQSDSLGPGDSAAVSGGLLFAVPVRILRRALSPSLTVHSDKNVLNYAR